MNIFEKVFTKKKEKPTEIGVEKVGETVEETVEGTKALEDMGEAMKLKLDTENLVESIENNPEAIISKAEKNKEFNKKLKTFLGVTGMVLGGVSIAYSFGNPDEMSVALREFSRVAGLSAAGASAVYMALGEKIRNMKVPDVIARFFEEK